MIIHFNDVYDSPASYWRVRLVWSGTIYLIIKLEGGGLSSEPSPSPCIYMYFYTISRHLHLLKFVDVDLVVNVDVS